MLYHKIETLFERDEKTFKVIPSKIKNPVFSLINEWEFTEKIDGTNIRVIYEGDKEILYGGRTEKADLPQGIIDYLKENVCPVKMYELFGDKKVILFGEGYGAKIQSGGGYSPTQKFIVFDILVADRFWLKHGNIEDICQKLGLDVVPSIGRMTLDEAVEMVKKGFKSKIGDGSVDSEGLIGRTPFPLFDGQGKRLICKIKTKDF